MFELIDNCFDAVFHYLWEADGQFYVGALAGIVLILSVAFSVIEAKRDCKKIKAFFKPIDPSLKPLPSGFQTMLGCMWGMFRLGCLIVVISTVVVSCGRSLVVP